MGLLKHGGKLSHFRAFEGHGRIKTDSKVSFARAQSTIKLKAPATLDCLQGDMTWAKGQRCFPGEAILKLVSKGGN